MDNQVRQVFTFCNDDVEKANKYVVIRAETRVRCREIMVNLFGAKWSFQYENEEEAGVERFGLELLYAVAEILGPRPYKKKKAVENGITLAERRALLGDD